MPLAIYFAVLAYRYLRTAIRVSRPEYAELGAAHGAAGDRGQDAGHDAVATAANAAMAVSTSSSESAAESCVRILALPIGTTG